MQHDIKATTISAADARRWGFRVMSSLDNAKASKARKYGYLNAILYMAPANTANGEFNLCAFADYCRDLCLGREAGQAAIRKEGEENATTRARAARAIAYMHDRVRFLEYVAKDIARLRKIARKRRLKLCYRFNGSTDVGVPIALMQLFPDVTMIDYTKNPNRMAQYLAGKFPSNYHLTFSRDVNNERLADRFLAQGGNVAVVFGDGQPETWHGYPTIDGTAHDIRTPEMDGRGVVVALKPMGLKAQRSNSPFIVRNVA